LRSTAPGMGFSNFEERLKIRGIFDSEVFEPMRSTRTPIAPQATAVNLTVPSRQIFGTCRDVLS